jgi:hypothetical protein
MSYPSDPNGVAGTDSAAGSNRILGLTGLIVGAVALLIGSATAVLPALLPLLARTFDGSVASLSLLVGVADIVLCVVALIATGLGIAGLVRAPRSLLAAWAVGVGGSTLLVLGVGWITVSALSGLIR